MVEGEMQEVSEEEVVEALEVAHAAIRDLCRGPESGKDGFDSPEGWGKCWLCYSQRFFS